MKPYIKSFVSEFLYEITEGNAAIFAGAGLSMPAGFVDWRALLRPLSDELSLNIDLENDLVAVAQFHVNANGQNRHKLHTAIIEALSPDTAPTPNHRLLAQLPIKTYWTTNYDKLIENSLREQNKLIDVKSAVPQLATTRPGRDATIFKMHGDVDRPDEAVATKDDYERYPKDRGAFITALAGDLVSKTFLFLGFSFTDPNLEHVLSQVRLTFSSNQRRHYAIFRTRSKLKNESDAEFLHHKVRQEYAIEDLKRFNVKVLLIDEYSEITEFLAEIVSRYRRRTVFISASAADFGPWGQAAIADFAQNLGHALVSDETRIATGLGAGVGDGIFTGALRAVMNTKGSRIEDFLVLRPFPQSGDPAEIATLWERYRHEIISHAGIALFLFGSKMAAGDRVEISEGVRREFEIAHQQNAVLLPIGATGWAAQQMANLVIADADQYMVKFDDAERAALVELSQPVDDLKTLIEPIVKLIRKFQRKV